MSVEIYRKDLESYGAFWHTQAMIRPFACDRRLNQGSHTL